MRIATKTANAMLAFEAVTPAMASDIVLRATGLPPLVGCTSPTFLAASPAVPPSSADLDELTATLANARAAHQEIDVYRVDRARLYLDRAEASPLGEAPHVAPTLRIARGRLAHVHGDVREAEQAYSDAYYAARAVDDDTTMASALGNLLELASQTAGDDPSVKTWVRTAAADADRLTARAPWLAGSLYVVAARVADTHGDSAAALRFIARARELLASDDPMLVKSWIIEAGVLMWSGKVDEGIALYERAIAEESRRLGANHPNVGSVLSDYAASLLAVGHTDHALVVARRALAIVDNPATGGSRVVDEARVNLAAVLLQANLPTEAQRLFEQARANYATHYGPHSWMVAHVDMNLALLLMDAGNTARAISVLEDALATTERVLGTDRIEVAAMLFNLAAARRAHGALPAALSAARRAADIHAAKQPGSDHHRYALAMIAGIANVLGDHATALTATEAALGFPDAPEDPQATAWPQLERARALIRVGQRRDALPLIQAARAVYSTLGMTARVEELDRLQRQSR